MQNKICPLLCACPADIPPECKGDRCAWWVDELAPDDGDQMLVGGRCAITEIAQRNREAADG